ncbi:DUF6192 family protein [Streptomyces sp. NPDC041068]|uniref:DUF6192 family protein n=1 Tax=Streptomyces sp. NPDC041068 TaxID=3155130 RepID=UPI0033E4D8FD
MPDEQERFEAIAGPPPGGEGKPACWTPDAARRVVGWKVDSPVSAQEKVEAIHDLAADDQVAAQVAKDFLRRPMVAAQAMEDNTARHLVNEAQFDQVRRQAEVPRQMPQVAPVLHRIEHSVHFLDLVAACQQFVTSVGRIVPNMDSQDWNDTEREGAQRGLSRVKAAVEWVEGAVMRGEKGLDEQLARLLKGAGE